jgi:murein DD-endopeptidase MepM/ murein hydrolase activator NlpD
MQRSGWLSGTALLCALIVLVTWQVAPSRAAPTPQIVQPGDVATPTATYTIILVATATATPQPTASATLTNSTATVGATLSEPIGPHAEQTFSSYTVQAGDTLLAVALEVGVDVENLPCAVSPAFRKDQPLVIGDVLDVPPASWRCYQVQAGESLTQVAAHFGLDPADIIGVPWNELDANNLGEQALTAGAYLRIPPLGGASASGGFINFMLDQPLSVSPMTAYAIGGPKPRKTPIVGPLPKDWQYGSGNFMWPVYGWMSQGYREDHPAIDIAAPLGTFVTAADRGVVIKAGWNDQGYGIFVVIDHKIDYITLYAHLSDIYVKVGDVVAQGQVIGTVGTTGNSTGPHLHFEIRDFGRRANPLDYLVR